MGNYRFNGVPLIQYKDNLITDISNNLTVSWTPGNIFFIKYIIQDGDTAENIAYRLWNDSSLSWIILLINNIVDPFFDWPFRSDELMAYTKNKYGEANVYAPHHYEKNGFVVNYDKDDPTLDMITNFSYEFKQNEKKRTIDIPSDSFMSQFLSQWSEL